MASDNGMSSPSLPSLRIMPVEQNRAGEVVTLDTMSTVASAVTEVERELGDSGRVVLRKSGTEPLVRVMVEAPTVEDCERHVATLCDVVARELRAIDGGAVAAH